MLDTWCRQLVAVESLLVVIPIPLNKFRCHLNNRHFAVSAELRPNTPIPMNANAMHMPLL